jgi:hypothetical protein
MFRKKRTKPCKGETHAVKFQAQVLGQKNPPFYCAPTGLAIVLWPRPRAMPWAFTWRPVGAGEAWFIGRPLSFGLEVRHTGGTIYKFTRGCGVGFLTGRL